MKTLLAAVLTSVIPFGCSATYVARSPVDQVFPSIVGTSLDGREVSIPASMRGEPTLLLVGYKQNAQFDLDRWLIGLHQTETRIPVYELPTIPGLMPGLFAERIDNGMRRGIPEEDWASVITIYRDAEAVARFTGNENGNNGRILLLDQEGRVRFFHDRGFSVGALSRLRTAIFKLGPAGVASTRSAPGD